MTGRPDSWRQALERRRPLVDGAGADPCLRLLHDEAGGLRCDRFGPVCWFAWYPEAPPAPPDLERIAAFTAAAGAAHWHVHGMADRGRSPQARRHWSSPQAPERWVAGEDGLRFHLRADSGQSPGLFVDQRCNRAWVRQQARGARVLNLFAYTGSFGLAALAGGAVEVVQNDVSRAALDWARDNAVLNGLHDAPIEYAAVDARLLVEGCRRRGRRFDGVVCDPPSFARSRRRGEPVFRVHADLAALVEACARLVEPGGWMLVSSNYENWRSEDLARAVTAGAGRPCAAAPGPGPDCRGAGGESLLHGAVVRFD